MTDEKETEQKKFPFVRPEEGIFQAYSNYLDAAWTLFDVTLRFAQIVPLPAIDDKPQFEAEENARITLAWPEAKILASILVDLVKRFEEVNGEITPLKLAQSPSQDAKKQG